MQLEDIRRWEKRLAELVAGLVREKALWPKDHYPLNFWEWSHYRRALTNAILALEDAAGALAAARFRHEQEAKASEAAKAARNGKE